MSASCVSSRSGRWDHAPKAHPATPEYALPNDPDPPRLHPPGRGTGMRGCVDEWGELGEWGAPPNCDYVDRRRVTVNAASDVILARKAKGSTPSCGHEVR